MEKFKLISKKDPALAHLNQKLSEQSSIRDLWNRVAPQGLIPFTEVGPVDGTSMTLFALNNAVAARLKMIQSQLISDFVSHGLVIESIRIKLLQHHVPLKRKKSKRILSATAIEALKSVASAPDSELAAHIDHLIEHANKT
jgi:Dna[CI] antecedent, DciA